MPGRSRILGIAKNLTFGMIMMRPSYCLQRWDCGAQEQKALYEEPDGLLPDHDPSLLGKGHQLSPLRSLMILPPLLLANPLKPPMPTTCSLHLSTLLIRSFQNLPAPTLHPLPPEPKEKICLFQLHGGLCMVRDRLLRRLCPSLCPDPVILQGDDIQHLLQRPRYQLKPRDLEDRGRVRSLRVQGRDPGRKRLNPWNQDTHLQVGGI